METKTATAAAITALRVFHEQVSPNDAAFVALSADDERGGHAVILIASGRTAEKVESFVRDTLGGKPQKLSAPWRRWYAKAAP